MLLTRASGQSSLRLHSHTCITTSKRHISSASGTTRRGKRRHNVRADWFNKQNVWLVPRCRKPRQSLAGHRVSLETPPVNPTLFVPPDQLSRGLCAQHLLPMPRWPTFPPWRSLPNERTHFWDLGLVVALLLVAWFPLLLVEMVKLKDI